MTTTQRALLAAAVFTVLGLTTPAYAIYSGPVLTGEQVPDWAVGNDTCNGTLITPRVIVTVAHCTDTVVNKGFSLRKTGQAYWGKTVTFPYQYGPLGDVGLVMTDAAVGGANVQTAPVSSYWEERLALRDGDDARTRGRPLVIYANDSTSSRFATVARTTDAYTGKSVETGYLEGRKMFYRSVSRYRATEPDRLTGIGSTNAMFNSRLRAMLFTSSEGFKFTDQDADDALILTAPPLDDISREPIYPGDSGGGIFYRRPDGGLRLISTISATAHPRLSSYWPWIVKTLIAQGLREDALILSRKVLDTPAWGEKDRKGEVGQIFVYDNPYSRRLEYLRLVSLSRDLRYGAFPINQRDNEYWEYLGTALPDIEQATTPVKVWGTYDRRGAVGEIFVYNNPNSRRIEYFRLTALGDDGRYWYFPLNQKNNEHWQYLGTDLPTRRLNFASRF